MPARLLRISALLIAGVALSGCAADPPAAVVGLAVSGCGTAKAHGTGTLVAPGLVPTAAHVVKGADELTVSTSRGDVPGTIVGFDPTMDLAYVNVDVSGVRPIDVGGVVEDGDQARAYVVRDGKTEVIPVRIRRSIRIRTEDIYVDGEHERPGFELDAELESGDSGGPVMIGGQVVGVLWARSNKYDGRAYAIDPIAGGELIDRQLDEGISSEIDLTRCV